MGPVLPLRGEHHQGRRPKTQPGLPLSGFLFLGNEVDTVQYITIAKCNSFSSGIPQTDPALENRWSRCFAQSELLRDEEPAGAGMPSPCVCMSHLKYDRCRRYLTSTFVRCSSGCSAGT